jgi:hypothetical protein
MRPMSTKMAESERIKPGRIPESLFQKFTKLLISTPPTLSTPKPTLNTANMSDWIGPNLYRIESYKDRGVAIAVKDGKNVVLK